MQGKISGLMKNGRMRKFGWLLGIMLPFMACSSPPPKNIILMISDGCGYNHVDAASIFATGEIGTQVYESFPVRLAVCTASLNSPDYDPKKIWSDFDEVREKPTDSAASGTAYATGHRTTNGRLGVDTEDRPLETILERAGTLGKSSGLVTSVAFTQATPAAFAAHVTSRGSYDEIARQMLTLSPATVIMGAGHPDYDSEGQPRAKPNYRNVGGEELWRDVLAGRVGADIDGDATGDAWTVIDSLHTWIALAKGETPKRLLGVATVANTLQYDRSGERNAAPYAVDSIETVPTLPQMTRAALNVLDNNPQGFFLMIEGGAVDWASHGNLMGRMIEEQIDFNRAVEAVVAWLDSTYLWSETLLVVTSDHETGYLTGPESGPGKAGEKPAWNPLHNNGAGSLPGHEWHSGSHTNSLVPLYAKGQGSADLAKLSAGKDPKYGRYIRNAGVGQSLLEFWPSVSISAD
ncbi:alkaline phosphatase [candidate division KSB1 bacterium]|nr:alkaline phosphatase [candidate division KSB1 bacterium]